MITGGERYYYTLIRLKPGQIYFQLYYRWLRFVRHRVLDEGLVSVSHSVHKLTLLPFILKHPSSSCSSFTFLNLSHPCGADASSIDWAYGGYGKLWAYNLNYFDFLLQPGMDPGNGLLLVRSFMAGARADSIGFEPYPISLRGINWIKFLSIHTVQYPDIEAFLYGQYLILLRSLEYHLLGNHLLENAFSLLFAALYFREGAWYEKSRRLLLAELDEQVLGDGAHFELSPMYHQILLDRLLDSVNLLQHNYGFEGQDSLLTFLAGKASAMLAWLQAISFNDGSFPHLNDATDGIAPSTEGLTAYAERLGVSTAAAEPGILRESGYRKFLGARYECVVDVGRIGPDYIPGHAHADTFNFVLHVHGVPVLVDTGISTYEKGAVRDLERGTAAHNTVVVNKENSSDVWGGFRVGRSADVSILEDTGNVLVADHDGYQRFGVLHRRSWRFEERRIIIKDELIGKACRPEARFHFDHAVHPQLIDGVVVCNAVRLVFIGAHAVHREPYRQALGFNRTVDAWCIVVKFDGSLETEVAFA